MCSFRSRHVILITTLHALFATTLASRLCGPGVLPGIKSPTRNATIVQPSDDGVFHGNNITFIYCSGEYYKTRSIDISVTLSLPDSPNRGQLLIKSVQPDNTDAEPGWYSYRGNATVIFSNSAVSMGKRTFSVFETVTGKLPVSTYFSH